MDLAARVVGCKVRPDGVVVLDCFHLQIVSAKNVNRRASTASKYKHARLGAGQIYTRRMHRTFCETEFDPTASHERRGARRALHATREDPGSTLAQSTRVLTSSPSSRNEPSGAL